MKSKKSQIIALIFFMVILLLITISIVIYGIKTDLFSPKKKEEIEPVKIPTI